MLIHLLIVLSQDGKVQELQIPVEMEHFRMKGGSYKITEKKDMSVRLYHKGNRVVDLTGRIQLTLMVPCARCLERIPVPFDIEFEYELDLKKTEEERADELDEMDFLSGLEVDADKLAYNEILVNWPIRVLCKEDCQGICSHCGVNLNKGTCNCDTHELDPRMAAIRDIFSKFKEV